MGCIVTKTRVLVLKIDEEEVGGARCVTLCKY